MAIEKRWVSSNEMRGLFNAQVQPHIDSGRYRLQLRISLPLDRRKYPWPDGTKNETWFVFDEHDVQIALVHCFRLPDGSIAASGKLDPKEVRIGEIQYLLG